MEFLSLLNIQLPPELKVMAGCFFSNHTSFIQHCWCHNRLLHACFDWHGNVYTWKLLCCLWVVSLSWGTVGTRSARGLGCGHKLLPTLLDVYHGFSYENGGSGLHGPES